MLLPKAITIERTATVAAAVEMLVQRRIGVPLVTRADHRIVGIISERDLVRMLARAPVAETMTRKVVTCDRNETIAAIMERITMGFRHVPVYSHGLSACGGPSGVTPRSSGFVAGHRCFLYPSCPAPLAGEGREGQP